MCKQYSIWLKFVAKENKTMQEMSFMINLEMPHSRIAHQARIGGDQNTKQTNDTTYLNLIWWYLGESLSWR